MKKKLIISLLALASLGAGAQNLQKGDYGYLYCHMSGRGEWTAYALSRDGVHFHDLIDGDPVYNVEEMSKIEGGARDAFICRTSDGKGYLMVTTDMSNAKSRSWFNYGINLLKSDDLIHWTSTTFDFRQGPDIFCDPQSPDVYKDYSTIKRVWAPQIFWDPSYVWADGMYNPQIQISAESETKRSIFREKDKTKRSKKESAQHSKSRNKSFVMTSVSAL